MCVHIEENNEILYKKEKREERKKKRLKYSNEYPTIYIALEKR